MLEFGQNNERSKIFFCVPPSVLVLFVVLLINLYKFRRPEHKEALSEVITAKSHNSSIEHFLYWELQIKKRGNQFRANLFHVFSFRPFLGSKSCHFSFFQLHRTRVQLLPGPWNLLIYIFSLKNKTLLLKKIWRKKNALIATLTYSVDWKWNIPICPCLPCARPVLSSFVFAAFIPRNRTRAGRQLTACCMPLASSANKQTIASAFSNQTKKCRVGKKQTADQHLAI